MNRGVTVCFLRHAAAEYCVEESWMHVAGLDPATHEKPEAPRDELNRGISPETRGYGSYRAQSTQVATAGSNSSRASGIASPHRTQKP